MIRIGVFFGGASREREVSFAGGRTVYDNLDKNIFEAIPIFIDPWGNMVELNWAFIYRGTIRDFYPPVNHLPESIHAFQIYADSLDLDKVEQLAMLSEIGEIVAPTELANRIDFAFLALHGLHGEDGTIQGLLEWYGIPYSGSSILPSAFGMNKAIQKRWLSKSGFDGPRYLNLKRDEYFKNSPNAITQIETEVGYPLVVKSANQGSSIGISILKDANSNLLRKAIEGAFFQQRLEKSIWEKGSRECIQNLTDIRNSIGFPLYIDGELVFHPEEAFQLIERKMKTQLEVVLSAQTPETEVVIEEFIEGREFSCIVIRDVDGTAKALPPTEIVKKADLFDYKSKYLPGLSRKVTPMDLPEEEIERIRTLCVELYNFCGFEVYARIDGFYAGNGRILLNDPNTTSGMMPSSFFFHQASEIGLNPSQFLTYIVRTSLQERTKIASLRKRSETLIEMFDKAWKKSKQSKAQKIRVAVIMGGYSTERHISVESGRNIYEKLASSATYEAIPVFLTGNDQKHRLFQLPVNIMLKDNADDIGQKVMNFHQPTSLQNIIREFDELTRSFTYFPPLFEPKEISYQDLKSICDEVFIALHGRPGEDGAVQKELDNLNIPFNGSGTDSSEKTIDKFLTNNLLRENGFLVADNLLVEKSDWESNREAVLNHIENLGYPVIAKPSDEGCSSAVLKLGTPEEVQRYAELTFRSDLELTDEMRKTLNLDFSDEFPQKPYFLVEQCISKGDADYFLEITGGLLTHHRGDEIVYEVFEPSETLASGSILTLAEKFLAGEGQNITPARFSKNPEFNSLISKKVRETLEGVAKVLDVQGYCRVDAFVKINNPASVDVFIIEINSLPGMTPATCIYHQAAINGYKPFEFIDKILTFGRERQLAS